MDERSEVQRRVAIEVHVVMDQLVRGFVAHAFFGDFETGNIGRAIASGIRTA